ncbi:hypothetical protein THOM_1452 [Trachipleistophora hominis]|uniref:Uncharacterized protein n=1 Tax=Trachipleistophora hominis TaxID=72359 RepID=L7JVY3_TRAHO|nr:hypothetical protein THOM_1452 [Trachipleistophora hominis]
MKDDAARLKKYYDGLIKTHKRLNKKVTTNTKVQNYAELKQNIDRLEHEIKAFQDAYGSFIKAQNNNFGEFSEEMYRSSHLKTRQGTEIPNYTIMNGQDRPGQPFQPPINTDENSQGFIGVPMEDKMDFAGDPNIKYDQSAQDFQMEPFMYGSSAPLLYNTYKGFPKTMPPRPNMNYPPNYGPPSASSAMFEQAMPPPPSRPEYSPMPGAYAPGISRQNFPVNPQAINPAVLQSYHMNAYSTKLPYPGYRPGMKSMAPVQKGYQPPPLGFKNTMQPNNEPMYSPYQYSPVIGNNSLLQPKKADYYRETKIEISPTPASATPSQPASGDGSMTPVCEVTSVQKVIDPSFLLASYRIPDVDEMCVNAKKFKTSDWSTNIEYFKKKWNLKFELTDAVKNQILDSCDHFFAQLCKKSINLAKISANKAVKRKHIEYAFYELENYLLPDSSVVLKNRAPNKKLLKQLTPHTGQNDK